MEIQLISVLIFFQILFSLESSEAESAQAEWLCIGDFANEREIAKHLKADGNWVVRKKPVRQRNGFRTNYFCGECKSRGKQCNARFFSLHNMPNEKPDTHRLFQLQSQHNHSELNNANIAMSPEVKKIIEAAVDADLTLKYVMPELRKIPNIKMPLKSQVKNYIKSYRKKTYGDPAVSIEDLIAFCEENKAIPNDMDTPYVIAYEHSPLEEHANHSGDSDDDDEGEDRDGGTTNWFRYIVTTKRLLLNAQSTDIIHADATNKITVQRYPLLLFGATDKTPDQKFHPIAYMISKQVTADDFAFGFASIRSAMLFVADINFSPEYLMADAAAAIGNGFKRVFGIQKTVLMCESHMKRAVDRHPFSNNNNKEPIKADLDKLKLAFDVASFEQGCQLFADKWMTKERELVQYIQKTWFDRNERWFAGAGIRTPTTNNALEGTNCAFKQYHTKRNIRNLNQFKFKLMDIVKIESMEYINPKDRQPYTNEVTLSNNVMKDGKAYAAIKHIVHRTNNEGQVQAFMKRGDANATFTLQDVDDYLNAEHANFDLWFQNLFNYYIITVDDDPAKWQNSVCTCPAFAQRYICKHITCIGYYLDLIQEPKKHQLTANQSKGRPKKASGALVVD